MDCRICILTQVILALMLSAGNIKAQPKAISSIWSLSGIGLGYEHNIDKDSFVQIDLKANTAELFRSRSYEPGGSLSFTWNMIFKSYQSRYGNTINLYAGPGALIGWSDDYEAPVGGTFGIKGRFGIECIYLRHVSISASISPALAMHLSMDKDKELNMRTFRNGLTYGFLPEIGIKYCF